jgi:hypothetical protein
MGIVAAGEGVVSAMSPYDGMKLAAATRLFLRTGRGRRRRAHVEEEVAADTPIDTTLSAADLHDWHPHIVRPADPRQAELFHDAGTSGPLPAALPEWIARAAAATELNAHRTWGLRRWLGWAPSRNR